MDIDVSEDIYVLDMRLGNLQGACSLEGSPRAIIMGATDTWENPSEASSTKALGLANDFANT